MLDNNLLDCVEYSCHEIFSCDTFGCTEEGICRCSTIASVEIQKINLEALSEQLYSQIKTYGIHANRENKIINLLWDYNPDVINRWCIDRLLSINKVWNVNNVEYTFQSGYYGEEIDSFYLNNTLFEKLSSQIETVINLDSLKERVLFLLELEYGKILENLVDKKFDVKLIDIEKIIFPKQSHKNKVDSKTLHYYNKYNLPKGLVEKKGNYFHVVDGYHRLSASTEKKVIVIVTE